MGIIGKRKLIILSEDSADLREIHLTSPRSLMVIGITLAVFFIPIISYLWFYFTNPSLKEVSQIRSDNKTLVKDIVESQERIERLYNQLEEIKTTDEKLRRMVKLPPIPEDIRKMGTGGPKPEDHSQDLNYLIPIDGFNFDNFQHRIDHAGRWLNLELLSYNEIINEAEKDVNKYKSIPAILPVDKSNCRFTSGYGMRRDPVSGRRRFHDGHDFSAKRGTPVYATGDGVIKTSTYFGSYGNYIEIDHGYGLVTVYGHLNKRVVKKGMKITRGTKIGTVGNTGKSTAPHLHYEIKEKGRNKNPSDYYFSESHI